MDSFLLLVQSIPKPVCTKYLYALLRLFSLFVFYSFPPQYCLKVFIHLEKAKLCLCQTVLPQIYGDGMISSTSSCANVTEHSSPQDTVVGVKNRKYLVKYHLKVFTHLLWFCLANSHIGTVFSPQQ